MNQTFAILFGLSLALFVFVPVAAANPVTDMTCGAMNTCCPTALSCICGSSNVVGCVSKYVTISSPSKPAVCDEFAHQYCGGNLVCVADGSTHACLPDPCYTTACF